jgi:hypothetical protein
MKTEDGEQLEDNTAGYGLSLVTPAMGPKS